MSKFSVSEKVVTPIEFNLVIPLQLCVVTSTVPPRIVDSAKETRVEVIQNHTHVFECSTTGVPVPSIIWMKDFVPYLEFPHENLRQMRNGQRLEIRNVQVRGVTS